MTQKTHSRIELEKKSKKILLKILQERDKIVFDRK